MFNRNHSLTQLIVILFVVVSANFSVFSQPIKSNQNAKIELKLITKLSGHTKNIWFVTFSPDGKVIATGSYDDTVRLWDAETGKLKEILLGDKLLDWQKQNWGTIDRFRFWGLPTDDLSDEALKKLKSETFSVSPDGKWRLTWKLAEKSRWTYVISLRDNNTNQEIRAFEKLPPNGIHHIYWSPNSKIFLVDIAGRSPRLFDISKENAIAMLAYGGCTVDRMFGDDGCQSFTFSADGSLVLKEKSPLRILSGETGELLAEIKDIRPPMSFSPTNSKLFVTTDKDKKTAFLWNVVIK